VNSSVGFPPELLNAVECSLNLMNNTAYFNAFQISPTFNYSFSNVTVLVILQMRRYRYFGPGCASVGVCGTR